MLERAPMIILLHVQAPWRPRWDWRRLAPPLAGSGLVPDGSPPLGPLSGMAAVAVVVRSIVGGCVSVIMSKVVSSQAAYLRSTIKPSQTS